MTITIQIPDAQAGAIIKVAEDSKTTVEQFTTDLVVKAFSDANSPTDAQFRSAMHYVLNKNQELYKRLA